MTRLYARSNAEAHLYMDLQPCACGEHAFDRRSAVIDDGGTLCSRYEGACPRCGAARAFVFELPAEIRPVRHDAIEFGGSDPSHLLDPGEWMAVADAHARRQPGTRRDLEVAIAALQEMLKFIPPDGDRVPDDAFRTERGRAVHDAEPGRFRRVRLDTVLGVYRDLRPPAPATGKPR
ncbi:MAG TPA: hypothetical protein VHW23_23905 [Kofleriaceae bacterium]|jgi:hypothetical protein|nr:hypothetical protein [Kofleriaceae bacterium]